MSGHRARSPSYDPTGNLSPKAVERRVQRPAFAAISDRQMALHPFLRFVGEYNGIEASEYHFREDKEDYLLYVGVMAPHKGPHIAIDVAKSAGAKPVLAGKVEAIYWDYYFEKCIKPHLGGRKVPREGLARPRIGR